MSPNKETKVAAKLEMMNSQVMYRFEQANRLIDHRFKDVS